MRRALVVSLAVAASGFPPRLSAAEAGPGATVRVTTASGAAGAPSAGAPVHGKLVELDALSITVLPADRGDRVRILRDDIVRLEMKKRGGGRGRHALIGGAAGLVLGLVAAGIEHSRCSGEMLCGLEFIGIPVITVPAGTLIGAAVPGREQWVQTSPATVAVAPTRPGVRLAYTLRF